jgi:hypothetical protein
MSNFSLSRGVGFSSFGSSIVGDGMISSNTIMDVEINGKVYTGKKFECKNGRVVVDGTLIDGGGGVGSCIVTVNGDATGIQLTEGTVTVHGSCNGNVNAKSGSISIGKDVSGTCSNMSGNITIKGDVTNGSVSTMSGGVEVYGRVTSGKITSMSGRVRVAKSRN